MNDFELVEHAVQHDLEPETQGNKTDEVSQTESNSGNGRKRKLGTKGRARKRRELTVLDITKVEFYENFKKERELGKENAKTFLRSLQGPKKRRQGKNTASVLSAPLPMYNLMHGQQGAIDSFEVILTVEVLSGSRKMQEFCVLGSQPLTVLRDQLYCVMDTLAARENMTFPSGFFFIENVFYNDMRQCEAVDYSEPILNYLEKPRRRKRKRRAYQSARMEETTFMDVNLRLGVKYVYCHCGKCKHWLVFRDIRLANCEDSLDPGDYPMLKFLAWKRYQKCTICGVYRARKVTYEDEAAPTNPCYFCMKCFDMLHGGKDKPDLKVLDYFHQ